MKEKIGLADIDKLAKLSALEFTDTEKQHLIGEVNGIIDMISECDKVVTSNTLQIDTLNIAELREDIVKEDSSNIDIRINAPKYKEGYFSVSKVVD